LEFRPNTYPPIGVYDARICLGGGFGPLAKTQCAILCLKHQKKLRSSFNTPLQQGGGIEPTACFVNRRPLSGGHISPRYKKSDKREVSNIHWIDREHD